ncbi:EpsG family protein [Paenibacillus endoradicis]|uniref:EpsG family protein n=1 Tax=Paenibacillus endoradicis TaxID=2972487 RepID=UPI00358F438D
MFYLLLTFLPLFIVAGFRFEVGVDYKNYVATYIKINNSLRDVSIFELRSMLDMEIGYLLLNRLVDFLFGNLQYVFVISSFITLILVLVTIYRYSSNVYLSVLFFTLGAYISSFNIQRQYIAIAIIFFSIKYVIERKLIRYIFSVLIASMFHTSAVLLLPLYFILNKKINAKKIIIGIILVCLSTVLMPNILSIVQKYFYSQYSLESYGMNDGTINNVIIAAFYMILAMYLQKKSSDISIKNIVLINWSFINLLLAILSTEVWLITRIMSYSLIFQILLLPEFVKSVENKYVKSIISFLLILLSIYLFVTTITNEQNLLTPFQFNFK